MSAKVNPIPAIAARFDEVIRSEAARRFGVDPEALLELEGTAFVYEGLRRDEKVILKITPGLREPGQVLGASRAELEAEVDYIRYLGRAGVSVMSVLPSISGADVEEIPLDAATSFFAYCFEKAPGMMFPDLDEVDFPDSVVREWGRLFGQTHSLAAGFRPRPGSYRLSWREDDCLDSRALVPADQELVHARFTEALAWLEAMPQTSDVYGLVHGDLHHGNFLAEGDRLTLIDFDGARYSWFSGDIATALFNCLPMPRTKSAKRREFSLSFLSRLLRGYVSEFAAGPRLVSDLPGFLSLCELTAYAYRYKNWGAEKIASRGAYLDSIRLRIEEGTPVVAFEPGDLESLDAIVQDSSRRADRIRRA